MSDLQSSSLSLQIANIFNTKKFSDVKFIVGQESVEYYGHKLILALRSTVFADLFHGGSTAETSTLYVPNILPSIFYKVLQYVYIDSIQFDSVKEAYDVNKVAKEYDIRTLQIKYHDYISKQIVSFKTVCKMFEIATSSQLQFKNVEKLCQEVFVHQTRLVLQSEQFLEAKLSTVATILKYDMLMIDNEMDIVQAVLKWGKAQCSSRDQSATDQNLRCHIEPLLKFIRFLSISLSDLRQFIKSCNILNGEEIFALTSVKLQPDSDVILPETLCTQDQNRCLFNEMEEEKFQDCEESFSTSEIYEMNNGLDLSSKNAFVSLLKLKNLGGTENVSCTAQAEVIRPLKSESNTEQKYSVLPPDVYPCMKEDLSESNPLLLPVNPDMNITHSCSFFPISFVSSDSVTDRSNVQSLSYFNNWERKLGSAKEQR